MLSYNFSCFQTPPRAQHEPLADFVPVSCTECHSPLNKMAATTQSYHTPSNFKLEFMFRMSELLRRLICTRFHQSYPCRQAYFKFTTYRTAALLLPQTFSSPSWSSRGSSRLPRAPTSLPLPLPVHQHSFLTGCVSWNCWAAKSEALSTTTQLPNIPDWPVGYRGCLLWLKHLPLCVPGRYTVTFSGVFPPLSRNQSFRYWPKGLCSLTIPWQANCST